MNRLNELADTIGQTLNLNDPLTGWLLAIPAKYRQAMADASTILRSAAAETVGTEWTPNTNPSTHEMDRVLHNADLSAARVRIAAVEAERDAAQAKVATTLGVGDGSGSLYVHGDYDSIKACQAKLLALPQALASLAAKQRAIDEAFAVLNAGHGMLACREAMHIISPHATPAATAAPPAVSPCGKPPRQWTSTPPKDRSGKWWHSWLVAGERYWNIVPDMVRWSDALLIEGGDLWLPWQEGDTRDTLPPLPTTAAPQASTVGSDDTRELIARLAEHIIKNTEGDYHGSEFVEDLESISAAARKETKQ